MAGENLPIKIGTWGGNGGEEFDITKPPVRLESMTISAGQIIDSFGFTYVDQEGKKHTVGPYGGYGGKPTTIQFAPTEYVKKFAGSTGNGLVVTLVIETNLKTYEIYGDEEETISYIPGTNIPISILGTDIPVGTSKKTMTVPPFNIPLSQGNVPFSIPIPENAGVVGFFGRAQSNLNAIGVYISNSKFLFTDAAQENLTNHATASPQPFIITKEASKEAEISAGALLDAIGVYVSGSIPN